MRFAISVALLSFAAAAGAQPVITVDRNAGTAATAKFHFVRVPPPQRDDAAANATLVLLAGSLDGNSAALTALVDGALPTTDDQPSSNVFFKSNSWGGRVRMDFGRAISVAEIHTYSWHADSRAPQLYKVFGATGNEAGLDSMPSYKLDPAAAGWKLIAFVDTRVQEDGYGGQYGVRIADPAGALGSFRYLLFDFFETESEDPWGNTFYSEVDVIQSPRSRR